MRISLRSNEVFGVRGKETRRETPDPRKLSATAVETANSAKFNRATKLYRSAVTRYRKIYVSFASQGRD